MDERDELLLQLAEDAKGAHNSRRLLLGLQQWGWGAEDSTTYQLDRWSHHAGVLNAKAAVTNE